MTGQRGRLSDLLMEDTEGMEAGSQTLWESSWSRISQANIPGGRWDRGGSRIGWTYASKGVGQAGQEGQVGRLQRFVIGYKDFQLVTMICNGYTATSLQGC